MSDATGPATDKEAHVLREPYSEEEQRELAKVDAVDIIEGEHPVADDEASS